MVLCQNLPNGQQNSRQVLHHFLLIVRLLLWFGWGQFLLELMLVVARFLGVGGGGHC